MSKRTDYLKEILTNLRDAYVAGKNLGDTRADIITRISKRENVLESTVTNCYRRGIGFDGTIPFIQAVDSWLKGSDNLEKTILGALKNASDIKDMASFFKSFRFPAAATGKPSLKTIIKTPKKSRSSEKTRINLAIVETLRDLNYSVSKNSGGLIEASSKHKWDTDKNVSVSVRGKRKVNINISDKMYVDIKEDGGTRTVFQGEVKTPEELRLIDRLTRI